MPNNIQLYIQQPSGSWLYVKTIQEAGDKYLLNEMLTVQRNFNGARVKATDENHRMVDILAEDK